MADDYVTDNSYLQMIRLIATSKVEQTWSIHDVFFILHLVGKDSLFTDSGFKMIERPQHTATGRTHTDDEQTVGAETEN